MTETDLVSTSEGETDKVSINGRVHVRVWTNVGAVLESSSDGDNVAVPVSVVELERERETDSLFDLAIAEMETEGDSVLLAGGDSVLDDVASGVPIHVEEGEKSNVRVSVPVKATALGERDVLGVTRAGSVKVKVLDGFGSVQDREAERSPLVGSTEKDADLVIVASGVIGTVADGVGGTLSVREWDTVG